MMLTKLKKLKQDYVMPWLRTMHGAITGHKNYQKFIIVCSARSGSNLLVTYLDFHTNICCYPEIFKPSEEDRETAFIYPKSHKLHWLFLASPERFLAKHFFARYYAKSIRSVGFKSLYPNAKDDAVFVDRIQRVYAYLAANKTIKVIHLHRKNLLASCLSRKRVDYTGAWTSHCTLHGDPDMPLELNYEECLNYFEFIETNKNFVNDLFKHHKTLDVFYEDLVNDKEQELEKILNFLGIRYDSDLQTHLKKQNSRPLCESIANYHALKQQFRHTPYRIFFED